ncbi:MAG: nucleotidyl transferase AbiEii/AbiGii toxin family protein [Candidatus Marinimicrobia bacterium]|nr:nucleotidyl transferase AbiEii/AbiGii toxin family protein [Candidatus Neomarinimicrobiota bacterium]
MINREKLSLEWINKVSRENHNADKILIEKVIRALLLLEGLVKQNLPFVFKGGTALMLHLNSTKRLSIDIDIILPNTPEKLDDIFDSVANEQGFLRKEMQHRKTQLKIIKEHYKFFYTPIHKSNKAEEFVLLDILFEEVNYAKVVKIPIQSTLVPILEEPILVDVPCLEDMLGDKLTAFAPNTTGIPYFKNGDSMSMEIIKQLYDVGNLLDVVSDLQIIKSTFFRFAKTELAYRNKADKNEKDVLDDILQTSLCIVTRGTDGNGDYKQLLMGIQRISSFIFSESFHLEKAITYASKAAYLSALIMYNAEKIVKFENPLQIKEWLIVEPMNTKLNKLKKSNPEAFFYWYKIYELTVKKMPTVILRKTGFGDNIKRS